MTEPQPHTRLQALLASAPGWVGGALTGVQAALLGLVVVITPAFAAAAAAPTSDGSAAIDWMGVSKLAARLWLLAHGVSFYVEGVEFTLAPLGLTLLCAAILAAIARRFCTKTWASWAIATGTYAGIVVVAEIVAMRGYPGAGPRSAQTAIAALFIAGPAVAVGIWRAHGAEFGWVPRVSATVRKGLRLGLATVAASLCVAALVAGAFTYLGRDRISAAAAALGIDPLGGVALAFGEALYAPNLSVWMLGWMTGQGFSVGEGSVYAPGEVAADAVPAFPLFGALPTVSGGLLVWAPLTIVALAALMRVALRRRIAATVEDLPAVAVAVLTAAVTAAVLAGIASGSLGPGRLAFVGVEVLPVSVMVGILAALGFGVGHGLLMLGAAARARGAGRPRLHVVPDPAPTGP